MNVLKQHKKSAIKVLIENKISQHEIARQTGIDRKTIRRYQRQLGPPKSPMATGSEVTAGSGLSEQIAVNSKGTTENNLPELGAARIEVAAQRLMPKSASACHPHRGWIEEQIQLGRNAMSIYQDLVELYGFAHKYNSVKRFCHKLKAKEPDRFDVLDFLPAEEAQVDFGQGAPTLEPVSGKYKRPYLFVMTLRYSRKSFRKVVWKSDQQIWARLHEEAFRYFGGCTQYVVLDNLKQGVIRPDIYDPELNLVYQAMLAHYGVVADPARIKDPNRKGSVENAIQHTQGTALQGRKYQTIEEQNEWLMHWEERWAAPRLHGRAKRQVLQMYNEEKPYLKVLPTEWFKYFESGRRTVDDSGLVQVKGAYYAALPARCGAAVMVRVFKNEVEIYDLDGLLLRRHNKIESGDYRMNPADRLFNPSRATEQLLERANQIGPLTGKYCLELFQQHGRIGRKAMYGIINQTRHFKREEIERVCGVAFEKRIYSYRVVKKILEKTKLATCYLGLRQTGELIRPLSDYQDFWQINAQTNDGGNYVDVYH